jgi:CheY-like chemotaxis protein
MSSRILPFKHAAPKPAKKPTRVLIVDDDEGMRQFVDMVLRSANYETTMAADGDEAIAVAARAAVPFDLLVTDEMMPRMRGHQLARYMRERYVDLKVLYLSGYREQLFKDKGSLWADEAFLDKPCTPDQLLQAVSVLLFGNADASSSPSDNADRS